MEPTDVSQAPRFREVYVVLGGIRILGDVSPGQTEGAFLESESVSEAKNKSVFILLLVAFALRPGDQVR